MKTIHEISAKVDGDTVTITAKLTDITFDPRVVQRQTFMHLNPDNLRHHRHIQGSHEAIFVTHRGIGMAFTHDALVAITAAIVPQTSYAPIYKAPLDGKLTVDIGSELTPQLQWENSTDGGQTYSPIPGQTTNTLDKTTVKAGDLVRLRATSDAGGLVTNAVKII